jgi:hypothetical protein
VHFDFTVTLGQVVMLFALAGGFLRIERKLMYFLTEHEMLILEYAERHGKKLSDLPTRSVRR